MLVYAPGTYIHVKYLSLCTLVSRANGAPVKTPYPYETQFFFLFGPSDFGTRAR